ncbi:MAG: D-alanine--D-alanine ligase family protein [Buchananella hordeovulneris]|nr:D-alanine--D-alanine ligase family protein [Buchananella hordeovulneris]
MTVENSPAHKTRVAVVFGGRSGEHGISCATAANVLAAIDRERFDVVPLGITRDGQWVLVEDDPQRYALRDGALAEIVAQSAPVQVVLEDRGVLQLESEGQRFEADVVLPLLHGPYGEDGTVQGLLELTGVRYVGCGVLASAAAMDKHTTKLVLAGEGLPIGRSVVIPEALWLRDRALCLETVAALGLPAFVKPARAGSSLGISRVDRAEDMVAAIEEAQRHDPRVVVEAAESGREIEVAVLGGRAGGSPRAAAPGEIVTNTDAEFYDFDTKYVAGTAVNQIPAALPESVSKRLQELAVRAFEALGCEGLARVDFFVRPNGDAVINEVNTLPGFTQYSMYPQAWLAEGMSYTELVTELIELALERRVGLR